jgi:hypothetical protein
MYKNAGKTTVLNKLIAQYDKQGLVLGITSIGRDGEDIDVVTGKPKPHIFVKKGTFVATATELLAVSDISEEILVKTGINTPMGEVVIVRAGSDGRVQVGGSSISNQIPGILEHFKALRAQKILIDGAVHRKTFSNPLVADAVILSTGAAFSTDMQCVIEETVHTEELFTLPTTYDDRVLEVINSLPENAGKMIAIFPDYNFSEIHLDRLEPGINSPKYLYIRGAVTDDYINKLVMSGLDLRGIIIIVDDGSKLFFKKETFDRLKLKLDSVGLSGLYVRQIINLVAITINPVAPCGFEFDKDLFMEALTTHTKAPVFNVMT